MDEGGHQAHLAQPESFLVPGVFFGRGEEFEENFRATLAHILSRLFIVNINKIDSKNYYILIN